MRGKITVTSSYNQPKPTGYQKGMAQMVEAVREMKNKPFSLTCFYPGCPLNGQNHQYASSDAECPVCGRPMYASHAETIRV